MGLDMWWMSKPAVSLQLKATIWHESQYNINNNNIHHEKGLGVPK